MPRTDLQECDIDLTAIMKREGICAIHMKRRMDDDWYFEVKLLGKSQLGFGDTVGDAIADAHASNAMQVAA